MLLALVYEGIGEEKMNHYRIAIVIIIIVMMGGIIFAQSIPKTITYIGWLTDSTPSRLPYDGPANMEFCIYDDITGGNMLWSESWPNLQVVKGKIRIELGSNGSPIPLSVFSGGTDRFIEIYINGEVQMPRQVLSSVGYAYQGEQADDSKQLANIPASGWQRALSTSTCPSEEFLYGIEQNGSPYCGIPASNTYLAGTGLYQTGTNIFNVSYGTAPDTAVEGNDPRLNDWLISGNDLYLGVPGNVGIGTVNPLAKLHLIGTLRIADGTQSSGKILVSDSNGFAKWELPQSAPSGSVAFFNLSSCPSGWTEFIEARGRYIVGLPPSGQLGAVAGTALSDQEDRAVGLHTHSAYPIHYHNPGGNFSTSSGHELCSSIHCETSFGGSYVTYTSSSTTGITINNEGTTDGTNAPYMQMLLCIKN